MTTWSCLTVCVRTQIHQVTHQTMWWSRWKIIIKKKKKNTITFKIDHIYTWYKYSVQRSHPCSITSIKTKLKVKFWKYMAYQKESTFYLHKKKHKNNNNSWQPYSQRKCSITSFKTKLKVEFCRYMTYQKESTISTKNIKK